MSSPSSSRFFEQCAPLAAGTYTRDPTHAPSDDSDSLTSPPSPHFSIPSYTTLPAPLPSHTNVRSISPRSSIASNNPFLNPTLFPNATPRSSKSSESTLDGNRYTFSSYQHPYDIPPPSSAYAPPTSGCPRSGVENAQPQRSSITRSVSFVDEPHIREYSSASSYSIESRPSEAPSEESEKTTVDQPCESNLCAQSDRASKRRGLPSNLLQLHALNQQSPRTAGIGRDMFGFPNSRPSYRRADSNVSNGSLVMDEDDPRITGVEAEHLEDRVDIEKNILRQMDYRSRRKYQQRVKIEFNVTSMMNRQEFLIKLARSLMTFGAPSHRIESQLIAAARILEVQAEFIHLPNVTICSFGDQELGCSDTHFIRCGGRLALGALHKVHLIYRAVVHDEICAKTAKDQLEELLNAPPLYSTLFRCLLAFMLSALICPLAFGGSFLDMWIAGTGALLLATLQLRVAAKSSTYANVFEITVAIMMSFTARGLSSIHGHLFCYTAISSSAIIGILPGYLILLSSLELASKNIVCGSVKMVYALIYTLFLGFGLQIGSDFYLLFDHTTRERLNLLERSLSHTITLAGTWLSDNDTSPDASTVPALGTWTFNHALPPDTANIVDGCFRPAGSPWYLQKFPFWTSFLIVPLFSLLSSLSNLQPLYSKQLPVMVFISCASYASNKVANHYIFNRSDIVSAIGAFTIGLLGNVYSRKMGGTAFTSMVTGVLFLVPSGLSQAGGITAQGNGIDIGGAMIAVTIGITVGLFMSQALVYMFGSRKNAAAFSF